LDSTRFDTLTRALSSAESRRGLVTTLALSLGLGVTALGLEDALARRHHHKHKKKKKKKGTNSKVLRQVCTKNYQCEGDLVCQLANSENGCGQETGKHCCVLEGGSCEDGCDCCGVGVICNGKKCDHT